MNRLTTALANVCREHVLEEKWLIAPSRRVGYQWLEVVTRAGQPVVNARVKTLSSLALELAGPELARRNVRLVPAAAGPLLVDSIWTRRPRDRNDYLSKLVHSFELSRTLHASIAALRRARIEPDSIDVRHFEVTDKATGLTEVMRE